VLLKEKNSAKSGARVQRQAGLPPVKWPGSLAAREQGAPIPGPSLTHQLLLCGCQVGHPRSPQGPHAATEASTAKNKNVLKRHDFVKLTLLDKYLQLL